MRRSETPAKRISPPARGRWPAMASASSRWPLPSTPATPMISPGRSASDTSLTPISPRRGVTVTASSSRIGSPSSRRRGAWPSTCSCSSTSSGADAARSPNIIPTITGLDLVGAPAGQVLGGEARRPPGPALRTETRSPCDGGLVELVGDEHDGQALALEAHQHAGQLGDALRGEHGGGLVQDQHLRAPPERLDDLDLLLLAERQRAGLGVRVELDAEHAGELGEPRRGRRARRGAGPSCAPSMRFSTTLRVGTSVVCW